MSDETGGETSQGNAVTPETGEAGDKATTAVIDKPDVGGKEESDPRVEEARAEAISERKKRQALEAKVKEYEDAKLSETERQTKRISDLETAKSELESQIQEERLRTRVASAAVTAKVNPQAVAPDEVWKLLDLSRVEFEEDGSPKNLDKLIEGLKKDRPALFTSPAPGSFDGGPRGDAAPTADMNARIRRAAGR